MQKANKKALPMMFLRFRSTQRQLFPTVTCAITCLTIFLSFAAAHAQSTPPAHKSLCGPGEKTWFDAAYADGTGAIAVCSMPDGADVVGAIRVLRLSMNAAGSSKPQPVVMAEARGAARAQMFTIKRYTRPQTTYLLAIASNRAVISNPFNDLVRYAATAGIS